MEFLGYVLTFNECEYDYQNCLEFVILCSNRRLKIKVTARQKSRGVTRSRISLLEMGRTTWRQIATGRASVWPGHTFRSIFVASPINKFTMVCRCVDSYLPRFTSSHGQNVVDSLGATHISAECICHNIVCTRRTAFAFEMKCCLDFHRVTWPWWRPLTNGSDVKYTDQRKWRQYTLSRCPPWRCRSREHRWGAGPACAPSGCPSWPLPRCHWGSKSEQCRTDPINLLLPSSKCTFSQPF